MVKIFDKIKLDIELDYSDELQQKNEEIVALKIQNDKQKTATECCCFTE